MQSKATNPRFRRRTTNAEMKNGTFFFCPASSVGESTHAVSWREPPPSVVFSDANLSGNSQGACQSPPRYMH